MVKGARRVDGTFLENIGGADLKRVFLKKNPQKSIRLISCALALCSAFSLVSCGGSFGGYSGVYEGGSYEIGQQWSGTEDSAEETIEFLPTAAAETQYAYTMLAKETKGEKLCAFYKDIYAEATAFHTSKANLKATKVQGRDFHIVAKINYAQYDLTAEEATAVWTVCKAANSDFYWISNSLLNTSAELWLLSDSDYASYADRKSVQLGLQALKTDCEGYFEENTTAAEKALIVYDYLIHTLSYAYEKDGKTPKQTVWAHNIAGAALYQQGVCETYAEMYAFLCNLFGIECIIATGIAGESNDSAPHEWNYLKIEDGWYAVDVTWGDQEIGIFREYFGMDLEKYAATHTANLPTPEWGITYQYPLPELTSGLCPVRVQDGAGNTALVLSIEKALATMTDADGNYEITLYPDTSVTKKNNLNIYHKNAKIYATQLPNVKHIAFIGKKYVIPHYVPYCTELVAATSVSLGSNVTFYNVDYDPKAWIKGEYTIRKG